MNRKISKKEYILVISFSFVFGFIYSLAKCLERTGEISVLVSQILLSGIICVCLNLIFLKCVYLFTNFSQKQEHTIDKKKYCILAGILMLSYSICLCTYFPGVSMNDGLNIMRFGMGMSTQFPILYCAFIVMLTWLGRLVFGNLQVSIALYSVCQIAIVCAVSAWLIAWGWSKPLAKWMKYFLCIYYMTVPILAMYAISMLKDTLFSLALTVLTIMTYELLHRNHFVRISHGFWMVYTIVLLVIIFVRNNGSYVVVPYLLIFIAVCTEYRKTILKITGIAIGAIILNALPFWIVQKEPLFQEKIGIPLQQIASVVANDGKYTKEQADFINQLIPLDEITDRYDPYSVDPIKWGSEKFDRSYLAEHKKKFFEVYLQMLPENLDIYVKAYLQQTLWFWGPLQKENVQCLYSIESFGNEGLPEFVQKNGIHNQSFLPEKLTCILKNYYETASFFFSEGVLFWMMLMSALLVFLKRWNKKDLLPYLPAFLLWITVMLSTPVATSLRYVFVFVYSLPFYIIFPFLEDNM